jgi:hypothetical protein
VNHIGYAISRYAARSCRARARDCTTSMRSLRESFPPPGRRCFQALRQSDIAPSAGRCAPIIRLKRMCLVISAIGLIGISGVGTATAQGATCKASKIEGSCLFVSGTQRIAESFEATGSKTAGTGSKLEVTSGPTIECTEGPLSGTLEGTSAYAYAKLTIELKKCSVVGHTTECEVTEPIKLSVKADAVPPEDVTLTEEGGTKQFAELTITSVAGKTCTFAVSKTPLVGFQECKLIHAETESISHELKCELGSAGSELEVDALLAKLEFTETVQLKSCPNMSVQKG